MTGTYLGGRSGVSTDFLSQRDRRHAQGMWNIAPYLDWDQEEEFMQSKPAAIHPTFFIC